METCIGPHFNHDNPIPGLRTDKDDFSTWCRYINTVIRKIPSIVCHENTFGEWLKTCWTRPVMSLPDRTIDSEFGVLLLVPVRMRCMQTTKGP